MANTFVVGVVWIAVWRREARTFGGVDEVGVVVVFDALLSDEVTESLDVAVAFFVSGEDVVVGDDGDASCVPDLCVLAELFFEDTDGAGATDVVGHEDIDINPDIFTGFYFFLACVSCEDFFGHGHWASHGIDPSVGRSVELLRVNNFFVRS